MSALANRSSSPQMLENQQYLDQMVAEIGTRIRHFTDGNGMVIEMNARTMCMIALDLHSVVDGIKTKNA